jgi:hypothetical protein
MGCSRNRSTIGAREFSFYHFRYIALGVLIAVLAAGAANGQTLLSQTTWGGSSSDVADGVAIAADGSSFVVGTSDSFAVDQFGQPSRRIFVVKFDVNGALVWQRIWNGATVIGLGRSGVALDASGGVFVTGVSANNGNDAALLKFDAATGNLLWERTWGGTASDTSLAVSVDAADGSAYVAGTETSFGPSASGLFIVKFNSTGTLVWQRFLDGAEGNAVAVAPDRSVYAAGTTPRDQIGNFDLVALKIASDGTLVWQRKYVAGNVVDPRGGITVSPDGSLVIAGAIQAPKAGIVDIAALIVKLAADGTLVFDKAFAGRNGEEADGVAVAANDGSIYVTGTTSSFGAGGQDAFLLHMQGTGKKLLDAVTWGGPAFEQGGGVGVNDTTVVLAATTNAGPPYSLLPAAAKLSLPRGIMAVANGTFAAATGVVSNPAAGASTPAGSTVFGGNFEAALVRIAR